MFGTPRVLAVDRLRQVRLLETFVEALRMELHGSILRE
jgi:hypothetical protein